MAAAASSSVSSGGETVRHWVCLITEQRRFPQMGYKSDSVVISGNHFGSAFTFTDCEI